MRQTLFYIPADLFGVPVFGFGIAFGLLVVAVLLAAGRHFAKVKKVDEEIWNYLGLLLVGGAVLLFVAPHVMEPGGFPIRGYGVCLLFAILAALALVLYLARRRGGSTDQIFSLCLWAVVSGILGARLFYVVEYWPEMIGYARDGSFSIGQTLVNIVNIAQGGLVVFGSILGGAVGSIAFMIRNRMPVLATFDMMAPAMMLGLAIGRIGCFLNGCCYGGVTDACWGVVFPEGSPAHIHQIEHGETFFYGLKFQDGKSDGVDRVTVKAVQPGSEADRAGVKPGTPLRGISGMVHGKPVPREARTSADVLRLIDAFQRENPGGALRFDFLNDGNETKPYFLVPAPSPVLPVHPTQLYSSLAAATLCILLLVAGRFPFFHRRVGSVFALFLLLYASTRFCLEMIRTDEAPFLGTGMTVSQNVSIVVFLAGIFLFTSIFVRKPLPT